MAVSPAAAIRVRVASPGTLGDVISVADGIIEEREGFGPGWRMYCAPRGDQTGALRGDGPESSRRPEIARVLGDIAHESLHLSGSNSSRCHDARR